ncbi:MAG: BON domain-containing protein [Planctomycetaceae bacterium]|nr:MAG: BON domain-containing protein [Planctomycetaceae bacterium]
MTDRSPARLPFAVTCWLLFVLATAANAQQVLPTLGGSVPQTDQAAALGAAEVAAPTPDNPEATAAESVGTIPVESAITDDQVRNRLERLLPQYPGVRRIDIDVDDGVVTLTGHVESDAIRDRVRDFVRRVEGVVLVLNQTKTDAQVLSARELAGKRLRMLGGIIGQKWLVVAGGLLIIVLSFLVSRLFWRFSDRVVAQLTDNVLLRSVLGSIIGGAIVITGLLTGLWVMGLTDTVLPGLGLAGAVALAVSFAFRDIVENFIASILLGTRRPFRVGDFVEVDGKAGVVKALNTRATILVTLDGHQVRIPNATVFKSTIINRTASSSVRATFDVLLPYEASVSAAQEAIARALNEHDAILAEPPPRALVEMLETGGVRLRVSYWFPTRDVDGPKIQSDARFLAKVALQNVGITPAQSSLMVTYPTSEAPTASPASPVAGEKPSTPAPPVIARPRDADQSTAAEQGRRNLERDTRMAEAAAVEATEPASDELQHALEVAKEVIGDEGRNLLENRKSKAEREDS